MSLGITKPTIDELSNRGSIEIFDDVEADPSKTTLLSAIEVGKNLKQLVLLVLVEDHQWMLLNL